VTTVYVTHDQAEAMTLGQRVAVLRDGRLQQCGPPRVLYERPANIFVAGFIGSPAMNLVPGEAVGIGGNGKIVGFRPEHIEVAQPGDGIGAQVEVVEDVGADAYVFCSTELGGETMKVVARTEVRKAPRQGERVSLRPRAEEAHVFDPVSGERLGNA
jgi:multiple sugar transport system ATP-binding protein